MIEILVGLVIGMIASLVVLQVFTYSEARNRNASGGANAQSTGAITLYQLQTNVQRAGYGLSSVALLNCGVTWNVADNSAISKSVRLAPVSVNPVSTDGTSLIPAGDANTDIIMVMYGNGNSLSQGSEIDPSGSSGSVYKLKSTTTVFSVGDRVIATLGTTADSCGSAVLPITQVTSVSSTDGTVSASSGGAGVTLFNLGPGPSGVNATPTPTMPTNGPTVLVYAVRNKSLTVCDFNVNDCSLNSKSGLSSVWIPIAENVVSMRAVYWKDNSGALWDGSVVTNDQTQPIDSCGWARIWGLNIMLVTRSDERDKNIVTVANNSAIVSNTSALASISDGPAMAPSWDVNHDVTHNSFDLAQPIVLGTDDATDQEWRHYRYRAFQTLIPVRNSVWLVPQLRPPIASSTLCS
ncbi:hypothetical protein [Rhodoferax sp. GW822-FHT02A01]|uniref:hypothetical protein n=1 Tax=Rhodoferax sp. GW822-FHT02A01 TaxID=3141537 RepID=UPI00315D329C